MRTAETTLAIIEDRGKRGLPLEDIYRQLFNPALYLKAYGRLYRNDGAMTRGSTEETVDGMSMEKIQGIIGLLREEKYRWTPVRRMLIPKGNGKTRPLGIPTWSDKLLQEVMRSILEAYYEPQFSPVSHGFRPERGCHTALCDIHFQWTGTKWFIEGDIKGCFDNIDHQVLMSILRERIRDNRFLRLVENLLKAGYMEQWDYRPTLSGTPQGGIVSPLLANIYLSKLDEFAAKILIPENTKGVTRRRNPAYMALHQKIHRLRLQGVSEKELAPLKRKARTIPTQLPMDPGYRRLRYIRYADDFLLAFTGTREEAEEIKVRLKEFLRDHLKLELSPEKTLITHAVTEKASFLGYNVSADGPRGTISLRVPIQKLTQKVGQYLRDGKTHHRVELTNDSDFAIVRKYGSEYRGYVQYYAYARNRHWLHQLHWAMRGSLLKTLANKHKSTVSKMARRFVGEAITEKGRMKCLQVIEERPGRKPLYTKFGGISLTTRRFHHGETIDDQLIETPNRTPQRCEPVDRLLAEECELCGSREKVEVHHIRKLADLKEKGRRERPDWQVRMAALKRKTLVVCNECHDAIHAGRPTRNRHVQD